LKSPGNIRGTQLVEDGGSCAFTREVLARIGDKWSVLLIVVLGDGTRRFSEIKRLIEGISQRMLTMTLRGLERDGLVVRAVFPTVPPRVEYSLSPLGRSLLTTVSQLAKWATENRQQIERAREAFDRRESAEASHLSQHA
jgi:DNA-binding HxlR family transcriptional regulator